VLSVQIQINIGEHTCASTARVLGRMDNIPWVAERAIPYLKKKPTMGASELRKDLEDSIRFKSTTKLCGMVGIE
jgi:hypothetical protein